jgi:Tfp pilus assembly protein PilF
VLKLAPTNAEARTRSAACENMIDGKRNLAAGKLAQAAKDFEDALKIDPNNADAKRLLQEAQPKPQPKPKGKK